MTAKDVIIASAIRAQVINGGLKSVSRLTMILEISLIFLILSSQADVGPSSSPQTFAQSAPSSTQSAQSELKSNISKIGIAGSATFFTILLAGVLSTPLSYIVFGALGTINTVAGCTCCYASQCLTPAIAATVVNYFVAKYLLDKKRLDLICPLIAVATVFGGLLGAIGGFAVGYYFESPHSMFPVMMIAGTYLGIPVGAILVGTITSVTANAIFE